MKSSPMKSPFSHHENSYEIIPHGKSPFNHHENSNEIIPHGKSPFKSYKSPYPYENFHGKSYHFPGHNRRPSASAPDTFGSVLGGSSEVDAFILQPKSCQKNGGLPSGELTVCHGKWSFLMGKSNISMDNIYIYISG